MVGVPLVAALTVTAAFAAHVGAAPQHATQAGPTVVTVDTAERLGPVNDALVGFGWHEGGAPLSGVEPLDPHLVRVDASLQDISTAADAPLQLDGLLDRVATVRSVGGEPLVILSYMPAWLGAPHAGGRDPTRVPPSDLDAWQELVHDVVLALATAPSPALRFEAWNEPDVPLFWQDTPLAWVDTVERSARAVAAVELETGLDLSFGGPATAVPDPLYLEPFLARFRDPTLPLDFVSWHYYGNYPFFGPDGAEFPITQPIQPVLGQPNPFASPGAYGTQIPVMRSWVELGLAGSGRPLPPLVLDEWNLSAAGFDHRHDTHEGAAFAAGVLAEMQETGLNASAYFRANDTQGVPGEHGLVTPDGTRKPAWWTFWLWPRLARDEVAVTGDADLDGLWAVASVAHDRVTVLLASFSASSPRARTVELAVEGPASPPVAATVRRIDAGHPTAEQQEPLAVDGSTVRVELPEQAVALVELTVAGDQGQGQGEGQGRGRAGPPGSGSASEIGPGGAGPGSGGGGRLPATGAGAAAPTIPLAVLAVALVLRRRFRSRPAAVDNGGTGQDSRRQ